MRCIASSAAWLAGLLMSPAHADPAVTQDEAKVRSLKAVDPIRTKGLDAARLALHQQCHFRHGDHYVRLIDASGTWLVCPPMPSGQGRGVLDMQDDIGTLPLQDIIKVAKAPNESWVEYRWPNPATSRSGDRLPL